MRRAQASLFILFVSLLLLSACSRPVGLENGKNVTKTQNASVKDANQSVSVNKTVSQNKTSTQNKTKPKPLITEEGEELAVDADDRIDITTSKGKGMIKGTVKGATKELEMPYEDIDALIFDASKLFKITLFEARYISYYNGNRVLKPSEISVAKEGISSLEDPNLKVDYIPYEVEWSDGFLRGVGCDRREGILKLSIFNNLTNPVPLWRDVKPRIKGAMVFRLNRILLDGITCGADPLQNRTLYVCHRSGVSFVENKQSIVSENSTYSGLQNEVAVSIPGETEVKFFTCPSTVYKNATVPKQNATVNTTGNASSNATA